MPTNLIGQLINSETIAQLAKSSKADEKQVENLLGSALPVLMQNMANNASTKEGKDSLAKALSQHASKGGTTIAGLTAFDEMDLQGMIDLCCERCVKRAYELQQGGFARSAGSYNAYYLAFLYAEAHSFQHLKVTEALGKVLYLNHISFITYSAM